MEIINFNVKHHMAVDILEPIGWLLALGYRLDCDLHFILDGILPESVSIFLVNGICLFDWLRELKPKLMGPFKVLSTASSHHGEKSVPFLQDMMNPPNKSWFMLDALCHGIFANLDWMQFFAIG